MRNRRRGFTLFELLMALTLGMAALGTIVTIMHALLLLDRSGRDRVAEASSLMRLGRALRADAHASTRLERAEGGMDLHGPRGWNGPQKGTTARSSQGPGTGCREGRR
jgi:type II secretory pathway component PulJ